MALSSGSKAIQAGTKHAQSRKKAVYLFTSDDGSIYHANFLPKSYHTANFNAKIWANAVVQVIGGKSGGKDESVSGTGINLDKITEAVDMASKLFKENVNP